MSESSEDFVLYSGPNYTGDSCVLPCDGDTYTLVALGLDKIASIQLPKIRPPFDGTFFVRLFNEQPPPSMPEMGAGGMKDFTEDTPDTEKWADSGWAEALESDLRSLHHRAPWSAVRGTVTVTGELDLVSQVACLIANLRLPGPAA
ncbi:hypothetical protein [Streptomyces sp. BA2]|uniref:hypothetical protein n=1 Tax=Streptomyces sp. BA2 TaxID=436595 RepID=UPI0013243107|nr:hypothetical protein [Streptomyces sp. BA2]MWA16127.1 hypothetical protein [Streptomyces sp. BA2]